MPLPEILIFVDSINFKNDRQIDSVRLILKGYRIWMVAMDVQEFL